LPLQRAKSFAAALGVAPAILAFPELDRQTSGGAAGLPSDQAELLRLYESIPDLESRKRLLDLVRTLADLPKRLVRFGFGYWLATKSGSFRFRMGSLGLNAKIPASAFAETGHSTT
jgi:hypothetical protein